MSKIHYILACTILLVGPWPAFSQEHAVRIEVKDALSGDRLPGASIMYGGNSGISTNAEGIAEIVTDRDSLSIKVQYLGYQFVEKELILTQEDNVIIGLHPSPIQTEEIIINAEGERANVENIETGFTRLKMTDISSLPSLFGETDVLKSIQLLPGVQSGGEGSTGFLVRGGSIDQNLILLDDIPIYNSSHLFGFFSVFNPFSVKDIEFSKSGFSARYGGRVSSVLNVRSEMPSLNKTEFSANIGLLATSASISQPVVKNKLAIKISARRTYIDVISQALFAGNTRLKNQTNYYFGDLNAVVDYLVNDKNRITISAYFGTDDFNYEGKNEFSNVMHWTNALGGISWKHIFNEKLSFRTLLYLTDYKISYGAALNSYDLNIFSRIRDVGFKNDWFLEMRKHHDLSFGIQLTDHFFVPNNFDIFIDSERLDTGQKNELYGMEGGAYIEDDFEINEKLSARIGLRYNFYLQTGPFSRYLSDENYILQDTLTYSDREKIQDYHNLEPRFSARYLINETSSLKFSLDISSQYIHLAPISSVSLPTDVWVPSSQRIKPQKGVQYSLVYNRNFDQGYETSAGLYYKDMRRLIEYRNGVLLGYGAGYNYDDNFVFGNSNSYGLELYASKTKGNTTGWASYMLSKTDRTFKELNDGKPFPSKYDRRHDFSLSVSHKINERWKFSGIFVYGTGNALTVPVGRFVIDGNVINDYAGRNNFRMPAYHRMDVSAELKSKPHKKVRGTWVFSIYNIYNRQNPYYIYFDINGNLSEYNLQIDPTQISLFPILPSISYKIKI